MTRHIDVDSTALKTIFHECQQCGTCCKKYRKITLQPDEVDFIKKMGGHVGIDVTLAEIRAKGLTRAREEAMAGGKIFMIHPDDKGCLFLQKRNGKYYCKIYNYRPRTCRGFKCNLADGTFLDLFGQDSINLLGQNSYGLPLS
jgi:uncharacterized protein